MNQLKISLFLLFFVILNAMAATAIIHISKEHSTFTIDLPANATTGYSWGLGKHDPLIQLISSTYYPPTNTRLRGAPGHTVFLFKVSSNAFSMKKDMLLEVVYQRPWNQDIGSKRNYQIVTDLSD